MLLRRERLDEIDESFGRTQEAGIEEIEDRPQVAQIVFDRRAGQHDAASGEERFDRLRLLGVRVFDDLGLVQHREAPLGLGDPG